MTVVTLSTEQARLIDGCTSEIVLVDPSGREVGNVTQVRDLPPDATETEVVAEIKRRMAADDGIRRTHAEVTAHLRALAPG